MSTPLADTLTLMEVLPGDFLCRELLEKGVNTQKKEEFCVFLEGKERNSSKKWVKEWGQKETLSEILVNQTVYEFPTLIAVHSSFKKEYLSRREAKEWSFIVTLKIATQIHNWIDDKGYIKVFMELNWIK